MRELARPYWIFLTITLPQSALLFLYASSFLVIRTLMPEEAIFSWKLYGSLLLLLLCAGTVYGIVLAVKRKTVHMLFGVLIFLTYLPLLYVFLLNESSIIPFGVPRWMFERGDLFLYAFTFLMPAFAHGLVLLVLGLTPREKEHPLKGTIIGVVIIPACWYVWLNVGIPMLKSLFGWTSWSVFDRKFMMHAVLILVIVSTVVFLFYAVRLVYLLLLKKPLDRYRRVYLYKLFFLVLLPLLCFGVYNGLMQGGKGYGEVFNFLGDLSSPWYYITAAMNGVLLSLPDFRDRRLRLALFLAKSVTCSFVFYFFLAMLPFLPLAIPAIIAVGLGFLMLTPLLVMVVHAQSLAADHRFLKAHYGGRSMTAVFLAGFLVLPLGIAGSFMHDRATLNRMLELVYHPDLAADAPRIDLTAARRTLDSIKINKEATTAFMPERKPYITPFYQWLVLDNMTLSNRKLQTLERIFWGGSDVNVRESADAPVRGPRPAVVSIRTEAGASENRGYTRTWVHLEIKNDSTGRQQEYVTRFRLPAGAWIGDYYLKIGTERVKGILTDRKSATWVYQQITSEGKDPGILHYLDSGEIMLRVFPFAAGETRSTGFELIHRGPVRLDIDGRVVALRGQDREGTASAWSGNVVFVPESVKAALPRISRKPYYHFILDCSADAETASEDLVARIRKFMSRRPGAGEGARITAANYRTATFDLKDGWEDKVRQFPGRGGFFLERAMKTILFRNYQERSRSYPVVIVVSDHPVNAVSVEGLNGFASLLPEKNSYYELGPQGELRSRPLRAPRIGTVKHLDRTADHVLAWPDEKDPVSYLPDDGQASIILRPGAGISPADLQDASWENALALEGMSRYLELYPSHSGPVRLAVIRNSFRTRILAPVTSFIALENEAQRQALLRKQEQVLAANTSLDIGEESQMSEPPLYVMLILLLLTMAFPVLIRGRRDRVS